MRYHQFDSEHSFAKCVYVCVNACVRVCVHAMTPQSLQNVLTMHKSCRYLHSHGLFINLICSALFVFRKKKHFLFVSKKKRKRIPNCTKNEPNEIWTGDFLLVDEFTADFSCDHFYMATLFDFLPKQNRCTSMKFHRYWRHQATTTLNIRIFSHFSPAFWLASLQFTH